MLPLADLFPHLPHRSEFNRRVRWPWGSTLAVVARTVAA